MKKIEKYVAKNGSEFDTKEDALHRENLLDEINRIESLLPKHPNTTNFANGHGYIQHKAATITQARNMFYELACEKISVLSGYDIKSYGFARYLSDNNNSPFYKLYLRIVLCVDDNTWREYGQPYFVSHPDEVEQFYPHED